MISVGIFTGYYPYDVDEVIKRIKASDFNCVQLDVSFKDCDAAKGELTHEKAVEIRNKFRQGNPPQEHRLSQDDDPVRAGSGLHLCCERDGHL